MKTCTKCKVPQEKERFHKNNKTFDGLSPWCKKCKKEYQDEKSPVKRVGDNWMNILIGH